MALLAHEFQEVACAQRLFAVVFAFLIDGGTHKVHHRHPRNFHRVLETEEQTFVGTVFGRECQEVFAVKFHFATGHSVGRVAGEHCAERTLARAVRTHNGVNFTRLHREVDAFQNLLALNRGA